VTSATRQREKQPGKVFLVGAGPGDPELLTLKAARVLRDAEVILHDDLVSEAIIDAFCRHARLIEVGKRGGCRSTAQRFIERLLIAEARAGRRVVRLKGGDPFVFGRGGEEMIALHAAGIEVEVVNGITSGLAAPTALGIPLTRRDACHGAIFVTGHATDDAEGPDWTALAAAAQSGLTLVIYMGMSRLGAITDALLRGGLDGGTPAAVVQNATLPDQRALFSSLRRLECDCATRRLASPGVIVIGEVVREAAEQAIVSVSPCPRATAGIGER
jgi:uroporphyrin-III C-methyltransferase